MGGNALVEPGVNEIRVFKAGIRSEYISME